MKKRFKTDKKTKAFVKMITFSLQAINGIFATLAERAKEMMSSYGTFFNWTLP